MPSSRTKQLAKELGLLKRGYELVSGKSNNKRRRVQLFSHIIVLDFESTCWEHKKGSQEIIEFPGVLVDVGEGKVIAEFQQYVQPQESPVLSSFCTELTGIVQEQVDNGVPLPTCLMLFNNWLRKMERQYSFNMALPGQDYSSNSEGSLCVLATWTDWDLEVCMKYECQRKQIKKPPYFNQWVDLKATYKTFYERKPAGVKGALADLGIEFKGREHCGLDDARNTASICIRLMDDGCQLKITKSIHKGEIIATELPSLRPCQLPVVTKPNSVAVSDKDQPSSIERTSCFGIEQNDSFNIPSEAWVDMSIPDINPVLLVNHTPKNAAASSDSEGPNYLPTVNTVIGKSLTGRAVTDYVNIPTSFSDSVTRSSSKPWTSPTCSTNQIISPFPVKSNFYCRQTSTPIISDRHGNSRMSASSSSNGSSPSLFKTPSISNSCREQTPGTSSMSYCSLTGKATPPLCKCGKRTKRKLVSAEGPNEGKPFYCCCMNRQKGCGFFQWESSILKKYHGSEFSSELLTSEYD